MSSKLNSALRDVLAKKLRWLPALLPEWIEEFDVQIVDLDTLSLQSWRPAGGKMLATGLMRMDRIYFISIDGQILGEVGRTSMQVKCNLLVRLFSKREWTERESFFPETVEQTIERLRPDSLRTQYILKLDHWDRDATLYKVPKGRSLGDHFMLKQQEVGAKLSNFLEKA